MLEKRYASMTDVSSVLWVCPDLVDCGDALVSFSSWAIGFLCCRVALADQPAPMSPCASSPASHSHCSPSDLALVCGYISLCLVGCMRLQPPPARTPPVGPALPFTLSSRSDAPCTAIGAPLNSVPVGVPKPSRWNPPDNWKSYPGAVPASAVPVVVASSRGRPSRGGRGGSARGGRGGRYEALVSL